MSSSNNFIKDSIGLLLNRGSVIVANLSIIILFSHILQKDTYGAFQSFWFQLSIYSTIAGLGLSIYLYSYSKEKINTLLKIIFKRYLYKYLLLLSILSIAFVCNITFSNATLASSSISKLCIFFYFLTFSVNLILETFNIIFDNIRKVVIIAWLYTLSYILTSIAYAENYINLDFYLLILACISSFKTILLGAWMYHKIDLKNTHNLENAHTVIQQAKKHWLHIGIYDILQLIFRNIDKLIISYLVSKALLATYFNATYEIPIFALVFSSIQNASLLRINKQAPNDQEIARITLNSNIFLGIFISAALTFLAIYNVQFLTLVFSEKYAAASGLFLVALIKVPSYCFNLNPYFQYKERGDILNKGLVIDIICTLMLMLPLYYLLSLEGILIATIIGTYTQIGYNIYQFNKHSKIAITKFIPIKEWTIYLLLFGGINVALYYLLELIQQKTMINMFIQFGITGIIAIVLLYKHYRSSLN